MKNIFLFIALALTISCKSQTVYPLRTFTELPPNSYLKDTNNELTQYEGVWKGTWNNKTIFITIKKIVNIYDNVLMYQKDFLIAKFKVIDANGNVRFDNTALPDNKAKITGGKFRKKDDKYSFSYIDRDLCGITGYIMVNFTDSSKTKLQWVYSKDNDWVDSDCFYWGKPASERPDPLPHSIILTKQ
ncbi:DUF6705 family protein [Chryseobacterium sp. HSC-36S06]|uniref:DUF6705 family protein n=1 Tax=Chryseobacterium sp. HSC-36S06 TaxID=2910970 RepID=UPI00209F0D75|nr:DUF6705 family protein [Chryseobacterium sp. HSC-36S06]MCP2038804.1 hypothetical protein [Chryseobacterium sp. HSC-36S06]